MNLKNLSLASLLLIMAGCDDAQIDQALVDQLWTKAIQVVGINPETSKPEIVMIEDDLYAKILQLNCESLSGKSSEDCLTERKELEESVLPKTGKNYQERYAGYIRTERDMMTEDCEKYSDKEKKDQCKADKPSKQNDYTVLGRSFLADDYVEIYYKTIQKNIWAHLDHAFIGNAKKEASFYSVVAHEMLHVAMHKKNIPAIDHHRLMRDTYMDPMINFISDYKKIDRNGFHRKRAFSSLEVGVASDEEWKRLNERKNARQSGQQNNVPTLHCDRLNH